MERGSLSFRSRAVSSAVVAALRAARHARARRRHPRHRSCLSTRPQRSGLPMLCRRPSAYVQSIADSHPRCFLRPEDGRAVDAFLARIPCDRRSRHAARASRGQRRLSLLRIASRLAIAAGRQLDLGLTADALSAGDQYSLGPRSKAGDADPLQRGDLRSFSFDPNAGRARVRRRSVRLVRARRMGRERTSCHQDTEPLRLKVHLTRNMSFAGDEMQLTPRSFAPIFHERTDRRDRHLACGVARLLCAWHRQRRSIVRRARRRGGCRGLTHCGRR